MTRTPIWRRYARLFGPDPAADVKDELRFHLEAKIDDLVAQGWTPAAARQEAERQFGDLRAVQQIGDTHRRENGTPQTHSGLLERLATGCPLHLPHTRAAIPALPPSPFSSWRLAIGANIAVFSVVNTLLLRPLPFPDSHELVWIAPPPTACGLSCATYSADAYEEFRAQSRVYQDVTGYVAFTTPDNLRLTGRGEPKPATGIEVIGNFFQVLGVQPAMGRLFTADEARGGSHPVALLANAYWRRQFDADPAIVGKAIDLNGTPITVVGVLARQLRLRRGVFSRRESRSLHPARPESGARLGQHRHAARPPEAGRDRGPGSRRRQPRRAQYLLQREISRDAGPL